MSIMGSRVLGFTTLLFPQWERSNSTKINQSINQGTVRKRKARSHDGAVGFVVAAVA